MLVHGAEFLLGALFVFWDVRGGGGDQPRGSQASASVDDDAALDRAMRADAAVTSIQARRATVVVLLLLVVVVVVALDG